jgi:phosphonate transport system substrate-binding protein
MSAVLGEKIVLVIPRDFHTFWRGVKAGDYDIVHYNQYHYIVSHKKMGYRILVTNKEFGSRTIAGALSIRKDSNIHSLKDLKGKTIIFGGGRQAMGSYIAPTAMLKRAGLVAGRDYKVRFANNPPSAVIATYTRIADASGVGDIILRIRSVINHIDTDKIRILAVSEPFIHLAWATHPRVGRKKAERIRRFMLSLENTPTGRVILKSAYLTGFYKASDRDFDKVREIVFYTLGEKY